MAAPQNIGDWSRLPFFTETDAAGHTAWDRMSERLAKETNEGRNWQPEENDIFRALELTSPESTRVLILGQDPYETAGRATGLAFELGEGHQTSQSLKGIRSELRRDLANHALDFPAFKEWEQNGVLLLNSSLTVRIGMANSHRGLRWSDLTQEVIKELQLLENTAFLLWGKPAILTARDAGLNLNSSMVFTSGHPRGGRPPVIDENAPLRRFKGSRPFTAANEWLTKKGLDPVPWSPL